MNYPYCSKQTAQVVQRKGTSQEIVDTSKHMNRQASKAPTLKKE